MAKIKTKNVGVTDGRVTEADVIENLHVASSTVGPQKKDSPGLSDDPRAAATGTIKIDIVEKTGLQLRRSRCLRSR